MRLALLVSAFFLGQSLDDGSEVLASVGLEAKAESDGGGGLEMELPSRLQVWRGSWWTFLTREVPLP